MSFFPSPEKGCLPPEARGSVRAVNSAARHFQILTATLLAAISLVGCARFVARPLVPADTAASFEKRSLESPELREFIEKNLGHELKAWPLKAHPHAWNLELLTLAAYHFHPSLDVARAQWAVAQAAEATAGGRPNPTVGISPAYNFSAASGVTPWIPGLTLDLPIETAGKRGLRIAQAQQRSEAARWNLHTAAWKVRANVRDALSSYRYLGSLSGQLEGKHNTQQQLVKLLEERQKSGALSLSEVIPTRLAFEKTKLEWGLAKENYDGAARPRLAEAVGVPAHLFEFLPMSIGHYSPQLSGEQLREMRTRALQGRADLRAALAEYEAAQLALRLEVAKQYPDVRLGTGYQWDQGESKWTFLNFSAELPVFNRNQGPIAEATAKRAEAAAKFTALQAKVAADIDAATQIFRTSRARLFTTSAMFDSLRQQEQSITAQVKAGAGEQLDLLNARLERLTVEALNTEVTYRAEQAINQLEDALQQPLDRRAGASAPPPGESIEAHPRAAKEQP